MLVKCLVCDKPTSVMHMGVNICRACTVFYKRYHAKSSTLRCVIETGACLTYGRNVFWCRKCRLDRLESVLVASRGEAVPDSMMNERNHQQTCSVIDRIRVNHRSLSMFRLSEELKLPGISTNPSHTNEENYTLIPGTYQLMNSSVKQLVIGLFRFIESTFPEFQTLDSGEKWLLIRNYEKLFHCIDSAFRTERRFGKESFNFYSSYASYLSPENVHHFFTDCPDNSQIESAARTLYAWLQEIIPTLWLLFRRLEPVEDEFYALMGLAFWSVETFDASDALLSMASRYRTLIINELMVNYRRSIGEEKGASRVGSLSCLIQEIRRLELNLRSDFEIYRLLGAFDDGTLTYRLQL